MGRERDQPAALMPDEVHLWVISLSLAQAAVDRLERFLDADERHRVGQFRFDRDQRRHTISRGALRAILGHYLDIPPQDVSFGYGAKGKPYLAHLSTARGIQFNLSHCADMTLVAVSTAGRLGVDVEKVRVFAEISSITRQHFNAGERALLESAGDEQRVVSFFRLWTRREATAKALALDLSAALSGLDIPVYDPGTEAGFGLGATDGVATWWLKDLPLDAGHVGALCVEGGSCTVVYHDFAGWFLPEARSPADARDSDNEIQA